MELTQAFRLAVIANIEEWGKRINDCSGHFAAPESLVLNVSFPVSCRSKYMD